MPFIPHTDKDTQEMLEFLNIPSINELFKENANELLNVKQISSLDNALKELR